MRDISSRADVEVVVRAFYEKVQRDELIAPIFSGVDWPKHLPTMYNFWSSILLGDSSYVGNPFQKHINKGLKVEHFSRWLELFYETIDENYEGPVAQEAKNRAATIAQVFKYKLGLEFHQT